MAIGASLEFSGLDMTPRMTTSRPTALETTSWLQAINHIISLQKPAYLIICSSRDDLLQTAAKEIETQSAETLPQGSFSIIHPTIARISTSQNIQVIFTPSLMHFRACLSTLTPKSEEYKLLSVLGLPDLHVATSEFSAQAFSRNLALTVEVAANNRMHTLFLCPRHSLELREGELSQQQMSVWEKRLPILGVSAKDGDDRIWLGRTVMMGNVFGQWCKVVKARE